MQMSHPNQYGVLESEHQEIVARRGRAYAAVNVALAEDGLYRHSVGIIYSHGGFGGPISIDDPGFPTVAAAIQAGLEKLLHRWHTPFPSEPQSIHDELADLRRQIEVRLRQPSLF
jgi:hypothetical protein